MPRTRSTPLLSEEIRVNPALYVRAEMEAKCEVIADLGEGNAARIWDTIKAANERVRGVASSVR